jgi:hypothetical protein
MPSPVGVRLGNQAAALRVLMRHDNDSTNRNVCVCNENRGGGAGNRERNPNIFQSNLVPSFDTTC